MLYRQFDDSVGVDSIFTRDLEDSLKKLKGSPKSEFIFFAVSPRNLETALDIRKRANKMLSDLGYTERQFYVSHPLSSYWPKIVKTQIWMVGRNSQPPYATSPIQDACLGSFPPEIVGRSYVSPTEKLEYEASGIMDWPKRFTEIKWSVKGGTIVDGQGTRRIQVKPGSDKTNELEIGLEVTYLDSPCLVSPARPFNTIIERKIKT